MQPADCILDSVYIVFRVADRRFALPISRVDRAVGACSIVPLPGAPDPVIGIIDLHGEIVPVFSVRSRIGLPQPDLDPDSAFVIVEWNGGHAALLVDGAEGVHRLPGAAAPLPVSADPLLVSAAGDARGLILIQDLDRFLTGADSRCLDRLIGHAQAAARPDRADA